jgi:hypothetical protein
MYIPILARPPVRLGAVERRARRAELVVERVDGGVRLLADVARPGPQQGPGDLARRRRDEGQPLRLVVDAPGAPRCRRLDHGTVRAADRVPSFVPSLLLRGLEELRRRPTGDGELGVVGRQTADLLDDVQKHREVALVDPNPDADADADAGVPGRRIVRLDRRHESCRLLCCRIGDADLPL